MASQRQLAQWTSVMISDPKQRRTRFRRATFVETAGAALAAICALVAIWGFTAGSMAPGGISSDTIGGIAVLCFAALMFIAAGAGIEKRFITLIDEMEKYGG